MASTPPADRDLGSSTSTRRQSWCYPLLMSRKVKKIATKVTRRGRSSTSRISSKNQVTIPVEILRAVKLKSGDTVKFFAERNGQIVVTKDEDPEWKIALRELIGSEPGLSERCNYKEEREKWDATLTRRG